jgi:hypothetical protein
LREENTTPNIGNETENIETTGYSTCKEWKVIEYHFKHLNIDQLEGVTADARVAGEGINIMLRDRNRLGSLDLKNSDKISIWNAFLLQTLIFNYV